MTHLQGKEHLILWSPLCSRLSATNLSSLALTDIQRIYDVISQAWADSTKVTYGSGLLTFHIFCDNKDIPEVDLAPASSNLLATFIATLTGSYLGSTISNYLSGVRAWHTIHGLDWALSEVESNTLLKAVSSLAPPSLKRSPREPYTVDSINTIRTRVDISIPLHTAVFTCLPPFLHHRSHQ
jgi:hypothetical protein